MYPRKPYSAARRPVRYKFIFRNTATGAYTSAVVDQDSQMQARRKANAKPGAWIFVGSSSI